MGGGQRNCRNSGTLATGALAFAASMLLALRRWGWKM